jgi:hypothetical protein
MSINIVATIVAPAISPASDCFTGSVTPGEFPGISVLVVMNASPRKEQWRAMISW